MMICYCIPAILCYVAYKVLPAPASQPQRKSNNKISCTPTVIQPSCSQSSFWISNLVDAYRRRGLRIWQAALNGGDGGDIICEEKKRRERQWILEAIVYITWVPPSFKCHLILLSWWWWWWYDSDLLLLQWYILVLIVLIITPYCAVLISLLLLFSILLF